MCAVLRYTTQMDAARRGIITAAMETVAHRELVEPEKLRRLVADGKVVIPANKNHGSLEPCGIGEGLKTKININLGVSKDCCNIEAELEKAQKAVELKADAIMDLSCYGKTEEFRRRLVEISTAAIGTVPFMTPWGSTVKNWKNSLGLENTRVTVSL